MTLSRKFRIPVALCALGMGAPAALPAQEIDRAPVATGVQESAPAALAGAVRAAIAESFGEDSAVAATYAARGHRPVWTGESGGPNAAAKALIDTLTTAPSHALPAGRYRADELSFLAMGLDEGAGPGARVEFEQAMTRALLAYGRDIASGALEPRKVAAEIKIDPPRPDGAALISGIAAAADPATWLAGLAPAGEEYAALRQAFARMKQVVQDGSWGEPVAGGPLLRRGDSGERVEAVRARLKALGDLSDRPEGEGGAVVAAAETANDAGQPVALSDPWIYDDRLVTAVKRFQARHGLNTDGVVGPATLAALNTTAGERLRQIAANLERLRWLNRDLGDRHVMVNIAGYSMALVENGREVFTSRVVVGQKTHQTPEFSDEIEHMVVNPSWNVPRSIAVNEIVPQLRRDPSYLDRNNMELVGGPDPWFVDWNTVSAGNFPWRIKQRPGSGNALGRVKFMFPNDNAIYLHDTPSRHLFARDMRAYSHGCVRVEKPIEFAHILLSGQETDPAAAFEAWRASGRERWVQLDEHVPVHLGYRTAWVAPDGAPQFRDDIYGRDALVTAALEKAGLSLPAD